MEFWRGCAADDGRSSAACRFPILLGGEPLPTFEDGGELCGIGEAAAVRDFRAAVAVLCQHGFRSLDPPAD